MIEKFVNYLTSLRGLAENTAIGYEKDVRRFARWAKNNVEDARWSMITRADIDKYITAEVSRGLKPATTNRRLASIAALYNWMRREGYHVENPCKYESRRKRPQQVPNTIPAGDLQKAYQHATGATRFMLGLLATTGMRIQELLDMTWENINTEDNTIKVTGKGGKSRIVYTTAEVLAPIKNCLSYGQQHGKLFAIEQRQARYMIWEALKPWSNAQQLSPHAIRHTYATNIASKGGNVSTLATLLGHQHIETTQKYIDMAQSPLKETSELATLITN